MTFTFLLPSEWFLPPCLPSSCRSLESAPDLYFVLCVDSSPEQAPSGHASKPRKPAGDVTTDSWTFAWAEHSARTSSLSDPPSRLSTHPLLLLLFPRAGAAFRDSLFALPPPSAGSVMVPSIPLSPHLRLRFPLLTYPFSLPIRFHHHDLNEPLSSL